MTLVAHEPAVAARPSDPRRAVPTTTERITALARDCIANCSTSVEAKALFIEKLKRLPALRKEWTAALIDLAAESVIQECQKSARRSIITTVRATFANGHDQRENSGAGMAAMLRNSGIYNWPLPGGAPIGDATADQIEAARDHYAALAKTHTTRAAFMEAVGKVMRRKRAAKVRDALKPAELEKLLRETGNV